MHTVSVWLFWSSATWAPGMNKQALLQHFAPECTWSCSHCSSLKIPRTSSGTRGAPHIQDQRKCKACGELVSRHRGHTITHALHWTFTLNSIYNGVVLRSWPGEFPTCKDKAGPSGWMRKDPSHLWPLNEHILPHTFQGPRALLVYRPKGWMHSAFLSNLCPRGDPAHSVFFHPIQWLQLTRLLISDICETVLRIKSSRLAWVT